MPEKRKLVSFDLLYEQPGEGIVQNFGDHTSLVNALRMRRIYRFASMRLLSDLVEVMRGSIPRTGCRAGNGDDDDFDSEFGFERGSTLEPDVELVRRAATSSPCLFHSLHLRRKLSNVKERPNAHGVLLCQEAGLDLPTNRLAHLLAAAIARQFDEVAVGVTFSRREATAHFWIGREASRPIRVQSYDDVIEGARTAALAANRDVPRLVHVIVAAPARADELDRDFSRPSYFVKDLHYSRPVKHVGYDRIVFLCRRVPKRVPMSWANLLGSAVRLRHGYGAGVDPGGPYFSSFVSTVVRDPRERRSFRTEAIDDEMQSAPAARPLLDSSRRLSRDSCFVPFADEILRLPDWGFGRGPSPVDDLLLRDDTRELAYRWARAVTNRQVGLALSGGGASSYRLVPIFRRLTEEGVPIDIVAGVSGGTLIAAYYCRDGLNGLERYVDRGPWFQVATGVATVASRVFSSLVDFDLGACRVDATRTRFVAVTTGLVQNERPQSRVVVMGTLGEAVRASGAAPLLFAPIRMRDGEKISRFADGAVSAPIPARILKDFGADLVFAFNALSGPRRSNPISWMTGGTTLYGYTPLGRLLDLWVAGSFLLERISREVSEDAHVYFEPTPAEWPLLEAFKFNDARKIVEDSTEREESASTIGRCIADCTEAWQEFTRRHEERS